MEMLGVNEVNCLLRVALMDLPVMFTGLRHSQFNYEAHGQALWGGLASFRSGRVKLYFFQCCFVLEIRKVEGARPRVLDYLTRQIQAFHDHVQGMLELGQRGFLPLSGQRVRPCTGVQWLHYNDIIPLVQDEVANLSADLPRHRP